MARKKAPKKRPVSGELTWQWAAERIQSHIQKLPVGAEVPSSAYWRETLGISRTTIIRVFNELKGRGILQAVVGSKTVKGPGARTRIVLVVFGDRAPGSEHPGGTFLMGASRSAERIGDVMVVHVSPDSLPDGWNPVATYPGLAGILFFRAEKAAGRFADLLDREGVPWILYGSSAYATELAVDEESICDLALDAFADLGHRRIGILLKKGHPPSLARLEAWRAWHLKRGWTPEEDRIWEMDPMVPIPEDRLLAFLGRVTAVFCTGDGEAVNLMELARPLGVRIPAGLSILGVNNDALTNRLIPPLGTIAIPLATHGEEALRLLLEKEPGSHPSRALRDARLLPRGTLAPPRQGALLP